MKIDTIKVKVLLAKQNMNAHEFCKLNELPYTTFMQAINTNRSATLKTAGKIADAFGVELSEILKRD